MQNKPRLGTVIYGIASSNALDKSGERVRLEGIDISTLTLDGVLNTEHKAENMSQVVGKIVEAKKIYKESDCETKLQKKAWKSIEMPFLYIKGYLFDEVGHQSAKDLAAMLKFDRLMSRNSEQRPVIGFSIEGSKLDVKNNIVEKCIARKVSVTTHPCNATCLAFVADDEEDENPSQISQKEFSSIFKKAEDMEKYETLTKALQPPKSPMKQKIINQNKEKRLQSQDRYVQGIKQANVQAQSLPTPKEKSSNLSTTQPILSGSAWKAKIDAIRANKNKAPGEPKYKLKSTSPKLRKAVVEKMNLKREMVDIAKKEAIHALNKYDNKDKLVQFLTQRYPEATKSEILAVACAYIAKKENDKEDLYKGLLND